MYIASAMGDAARPSCSEGNGAGTGARTSAKTRRDVDGPEKVVSKVDITTSDKTNKTLILVSY